MNSPEPTTGEVLAEVRQLAGTVNQLAADMKAGFEQVDRRFDRIDASILQLRADVAGVKVDVGLCEQRLADHQVAIAKCMEANALTAAALQAHIADPNAHRPAA